MMAGGMAAPPPPPAMGAMPEADTVPVAAAVLDPVEDAAAAGVPMGDAGGVQPKSPVVHGTYEAAEVEEEEEVMVKTEFVWADGAEHDVKLSGAWNGWMPVQMYHEGGGMWSVVTPVPAGTHEFKFVVDGEWKHSTRHPTVGDDEETMNNVRVSPGATEAERTDKRGVAAAWGAGLGGRRRRCQSRRAGAAPSRREWTLSWTGRTGRGGGAPHCI
eukprot:TRINITY_DN155_c0_g1_i9.p2 TRINITY_DN155_c0_g1~~TRINITY_DN155_c0_g1_i9.p2  ORF type:complete len:215 (-),score=62.31 TRINITY_DN155_c0_g1_i9:98-742(-)